MFLLLWIVFHCIDVTHFVFHQICCFQPLFLQKKFFFSTQYSFFSDGTAVIPFGIVPQVPEALTSWKHCYLSLSVIHSANYFLILVIYSSVDSHTAISRFLFFFSIVKMLFVWRFLCRCPWAHVSGFLYGNCLYIGLLKYKSCTFFLS